MNVLLVVTGFLLVLIIVYMIYIYYFSNMKILQKEIYLDGNVPSVLPAKITQTKSTRYAYSVWVFVNSWSNATDKIIFSRYNDIILQLDQNTATLYATFSPNTGSPTGPSSIIGKSTDSVNGTKVAVTNNFPLQKWVYITISIDNTVTDIYLDGKMVKSVQIPQVMPDSSSAIYYGSFDAYISKFTRFTTPLDPQTVWNYYLQGNGTSNATNGYNIGIAVLKNDNISSQYKLF
jgi:hypothetical protein